jgi:hypothetical protein
MVPPVEDQADYHNIDFEVKEITASEFSSKSVAV